MFHLQVRTSPAPGFGELPQTPSGDRDQWKDCGVDLRLSRAECPGCATAMEAEFEVSPLARLPLRIYCE